MKMNKLFYAICFLGGCVTWVACEKTNTIPERTTDVPGSSAYIKGIHLSPDAPTFNLMVDSIRALTVLETAPNVEAGITFGLVVPSLASGYSIVPGGQHTISAKVPSTSATRPGETILTETATLQSGKYYTIIVADSLNVLPASRLDAVIVEDDLSVPDTSKSYFRILNFMMGKNTDIEFMGPAGGTSFTKSNIAFKSTSAFEVIPPDVTYRIYLRAAGAPAKLDSITAFVPVKGKKYSLYTRGVFGQTGSTNVKRPLIFSIQNL